MKKFITSIAFLGFTFSCISCVNVDEVTQTYTVDGSGAPKSLNNVKVSFKTQIPTNEPWWDDVNKNTSFKRYNFKKTGR